MSALMGCRVAPKARNLYDACPGRFSLERRSRSTWRGIGHRRGGCCQCTGATAGEGMVRFFSSESPGRKMNNYTFLVWQAIQAGRRAGRMPSLATRGPPAAPALRRVTCSSSVPELPVPAALARPGPPELRNVMNMSCASGIWVQIPKQAGDWKTSSGKNSLLATSAASFG
jgi:hypothetical protein